uniref:small monomeric GTPase n=1 Tax=Strigamia maritima TaxID=126957 RepID=T1IQX4_STRMM
MCSMIASAATNSHPRSSPVKSYDYLLKFLLVGDSDVGKQEILSGLEDGASESPFCSTNGIDFKTTTILLDGKRVKLHLWDTSGQGRFCTIIRSYSRGAQGILLVYDITNKWSFDGIDRWLREVEEHAPGVPKILIGNRLHLAFKRQVSEVIADSYASKNDMVLYEVSPLCNYNIVESFTELSRLALRRNGMERLWRSNKVLSLQELCCRTIVARTTVYGLEQLPLPAAMKNHLKSYSLTSCKPRLRQGHTHQQEKNIKKTKIIHPCDSPTLNCRKSCVLS